MKKQNRSIWRKLTAVILTIGVIAGIFQSIPVYAEVEMKTPQETQDVDSEQMQAEPDKVKEPEQADEAEKNLASEQISNVKDEGFEFKDTMSFSLMNDKAAKSMDVKANEAAKVKIISDGVESDGSINAGVISENYPILDGIKFLGAYVVTESGEDQIAYIGSYSDVNGTAHTYYAFTETSDTGILLKDKQFIKLVYKTEYQVGYQIRLDSVGGADCPDGGNFSYADTILMINKGEDINVRFTATKRQPIEGDSYKFEKLYAIGADGNQTEVTLDGTGSGKISNVTQDITICAVVSKVTTYKLIVANQSRGHVCWAGHGDEKNSDPSNPYIVDPSKFCSYDGNGSRTGTAGATVTTAPGGTIYFVMYSQAGTKWEFQHLIINGTYIDAICDGQIHTQAVNGMMLNFRSLGYGKDSHLKSNSNSTRSKFECWITNVNEDITVNFECESDRRETLTLVQADGIASAAASSFDRNYYPSWFIPESVRDFWNGIYTGAQLGPMDIGKDLVNEFWNGSKSGYQSSTNGHTAVETKTNSKKTLFETSDPKYGSRYVYFKTAPGYDPTSITAQITGQHTNLPVGDIATLVSGKAGSWLGFFSRDTNKSVAAAKKAGYDWYVYYEGMGINFRNLSLSCNPYQYTAEYDLSGGSLDGQATYTDNAKYVIKAGENKIILPASPPVKEGYLFQCWKLVPTNIDPRFSDVNMLLDSASVFTINGTTYEYGLETVKTEYELDDDWHTDYNAVPGGNHHFKFVAQWEAMDNPSAPKAQYTVTKYKEVKEGTSDAISAHGKYYVLMEPVSQNMGTKNQTIIGIPEKAPKGYILGKNSITRLENFMSEGNTANELTYYYDQVHTLTISKVLEGDYADKTKAFEVTLSLKDAENNPVSGTFTYITFTEGEATIKLKGDQTITIAGVETGTFGVVENDTDGYTTTYKIGNDEETSKVPENLPIQDDVSVKIRNVKIDIPSTGIPSGAETRAAYGALILLIGVGIITLFLKRGK